MGIVALMGAVVTWLFGFDVLYSLQDQASTAGTDFTPSPRASASRGALVASAVAHVGTVALLAVTGVVLHRGLLYRRASR